jgi:methylenetetrahydrofolate dehydrogenase (NADP+)/methenyltetrahydrofolate cyclohydrolase
MTKILSGAELVGYIKERQAKQVRALRQAWKTFPRLVILQTPGVDQASQTYVRLKQEYGEDILIDVTVETVEQPVLAEAIERSNSDASVHGIIVQLPLDDRSQTAEILNLIAPEKDVDGLGAEAQYDSATATAINWLLTGYGVDLANKKIAVVGRGQLVGAPLERMWQASGYDVAVLDDTSADVVAVLKKSDIIVSATGVARLITSSMVPAGAVVVDAGTASENGVLVGDVDESVRERHDVTITPVRGGVGPLTIASLFDHVITAAQRTTSSAQERL